MAKKIYVLDTNILMGAPDAIYGFDDNTVLITGTVMQELDKHKKDLGEDGYNTRHAIKAIEAVTAQDGIDSKLGKEYPLPNGGTIAMFVDGHYNMLPESFSLTVPDNRILNEVLVVKKDTKSKVILVTDDACMRANARMIDIEPQSYQNTQVKLNEDYRGRVVWDCTKDKTKKRYMKELAESTIIDNIAKNDLDMLHENEYIEFVGKDQRLIGHFREGEIKLVNVSELKPMGITPRNAAQIMALHALLAPVNEIPCVILEGPAGTGKTLMAMAAALSQTWRQGRRTKDTQYDKVMITRNNVLADNDMGFLPGDVDEKMMPLMGSFTDALEMIFRKDNPAEDPATIKMQVEDLFDTGIIEILAMAYIRGRSIPNTFLILDECQNASRNSILTCLTRAGEGTKIVICGDTKQIDNPKLDKKNNGLAFAIERMMDSKLCAQVTFNEEGECVRSDLAAEESRLLS